jgi:MarR family transcriptional regulator, transcriptional regulator for hemolysin
MREEEFGFRVARIARRIRQAVDAELRVYGLSEATWRPLAYLGRLGEGIRQKELAHALGIEGPSLVRLLDSLERRGLVERRADERDLRAHGIYLTRSGRQLQGRVLRISESIQRRLLSAVRKSDLDACDRAFLAIETALDQPIGRPEAR